MPVSDTFMTCLSSHVPLTVLTSACQITGSAFRITGLERSCYHHCTLLVDSDLDLLDRIIRPSPIYAGMEVRFVIQFDSIPFTCPEFSSLSDFGIV